MGLLTVNQFYVIDVNHIYCIAVAESCYLMLLLTFVLLWIPSENNQRFGFTELMDDIELDDSRMSPAANI